MIFSACNVRSIACLLLHCLAVDGALPEDSLHTVEGHHGMSCIDTVFHRSSVINCKLLVAQCVLTVNCTNICLPLLILLWKFLLLDKDCIFSYDIIQRLQLFIARQFHKSLMVSLHQPLTYRSAGLQSILVTMASVFLVQRIQRRFTVLMRADGLRLPHVKVMLHF